jgi:hypothetical protein
MLRAKIVRLPVVDPKEPTKLVGYLGRGEFITAYEKAHEEEHRREASWLRRKAVGAVESSEAEVKWSER